MLREQYVGGMESETPKKILGWMKQPEIYCFNKFRVSYAEAAESFWCPKKIDEGDLGGIFLPQSVA